MVHYYEPLSRLYLLLSLALLLLFRYLIRKWVIITLHDFLSNEVPLKFSSFSSFIHTIPSVKWLAAFHYLKTLLPHFIYKEFQLSFPYSEYNCFFLLQFSLRLHSCLVCLSTTFSVSFSTNSILKKNIIITVPPVNFYDKEWASFQEGSFPRASIWANVHHKR